MTMNRAVGYVRVSTQRQVGTDHYSLSAQRSTIKEMAASSHEMELAAIFADEGLSGSTTRREGFKRLCQAVKHPDTRVVLVYRLNRLARNLHDLLNFFDLCQQNDVVIHSFMEPDSADSASGRLQLTMFGAVAEFERSVTRENQASALAERMRQGKAPSSKVPYGYNYDCQSMKAVVNQQDSLVVQWLFEQYATTSLGYRRLTSKCNCHFRLNLKQAHVTRILRNSHYIGTENFQPLVPKPLFDKVQVKRTGNHVSKKRDDFWLHGKLVCPYCQRKLKPETVSKTTGKKRYRYYSCRQPDHSLALTADVIEQVVFTRLGYLLGRSNWQTILAFKANHQVEGLPTYDRKQLLDELESGRITPKAYASKVLSARQSESERQIKVTQYQAAITELTQAFTEPSKVSNTLWQGLLDRIEISKEGLVLGIYMRRWIGVNLIDLEEELKDG